MKKTKVLKALSLIVAMFLLFNIYPVSAVDIQEETSEEMVSESVAEVFEEEDSNYENYTLENLPAEIKERIEIDESAKEVDIVDAEVPNSLTIKNADGTKTTTIFNEAIKYFDEETENYEFIDNSLVETEKGSGSFQSAKNNKKAVFPQELSKGVELSYNKKTIKISPVVISTKKNGKIKASKIKLKKKDYVQYDDVFGENTSVQYAPTTDGYKENIVLESYSDVNEFSYIVDAKGLVPSQTEGTTITFIDPKTKEEVFQIKETFIYDSDYNETSPESEDFSYNNTYKIEEQNNGKYLLTSVVDKAFLESEETQYPVIIDPEINAIGTVGVIKTKNLFNDNSSKPEGLMRIGGSKDGRVYVSVSSLILDDLAYINPDLIVSAKFETSYHSGASNMAVIAYKFSLDKAYATVNYSDISNSDNLERVSTGYFGSLEDNDISITPLVKEWLKHTIGIDGYENTGFVLAASNLSKVVELGAGDHSLHAMKPYIQINYYEDCSISDNIYVLRKEVEIEENGKTKKETKYLKNLGESALLKDLTCVETIDDASAWKISTFNGGNGIYIISSYSQYLINSNEQHLLCYNSTEGKVYAETCRAIDLNEPLPRIRWRIVANGDGSYRIMNAQNITKALKYDATNGIGVSTYSYSNTSVKWYIEPYTPKLEKQATMDIPSWNWPNASKTNPINQLYGKLPVSMKYSTRGDKITSGSGTAYAYVGSSVTNGYALTDGIISGSNVDIRAYTLTEEGENGFIRYIEREDGSYREKGELYLDIVFDLGSAKKFNMIYFATNTLDNYYQVGAFEAYASNNMNSLFSNLNMIARFDRCNDKYSGLTETNLYEPMECRYFAIRITQGVLNKPNSEQWTQSELEHAYARVRDIMLLNVNRKEVEIKNFYDEGMLQRWNATEEDMEGIIGIPGICNVAKNFFEILEYNGENLGFNVSSGDVEKYRSMADKCTRKTINNLDCGCTNDKHARQAVVQDELNEQKPYQVHPRTIPVLWTGHQLGVDRNKNDIIDLDEVTTSLGITTRKSYTMMANTDGGTKKDLTLSDFYQSGCVMSTYLHELSHAFGAQDSYCKNDGGNGERCSNKRCTQCYTEGNEYEDQCIMANLPDDVVMGMDYNDLLCDRCKEDIYNYVR